MTQFVYGRRCPLHPKLRGKRYRSVDGYPGSCPSCKKTRDGRRDNQAAGLRRYGLTVKQFDAMLAAQNGRCAICFADRAGKRRWQVDHDHATGKVRGLLCCNCNVMLAQGKDDPRLLEAGAQYIRRNK